MGEPTEEDLKLSDMISSFWINFARSGDPNGQDLPEWPAFSEDEKKVMHFDAESRAIKHPVLDRLSTFDAYYSKLREDTKTE